MTELEKVRILKDLEPIINYNVSKYFNYRKMDFDDLMQDARIIIYENLDKYDESKGSLSTFCQLLIRNNLVCKTKKQYRMWDRISFNNEMVEIEAEENDNDYTIDYMYDKLKELVNQNRDRFTKKELAFLDLFITRKTFQEIESLLNITPNHRRQLLFYLKKKLKSFLEMENK